MLRYLLIGSLLVHLALLIEIAPEEVDVLTNNVDAPKKYHDYEHQKEHDKKKHKKYFTDEEGKRQKYYGDKYKKKYDGEEKYYKEKSKHHNDENRVNVHKDKGKHYERVEYKHENYQKGKQILEKSEELMVAAQPINMEGDTNVNNKLEGKTVNPNSEMIPAKFVKKDFYKEMKKIDLTKVPEANDTVLMARYIVHNVEWAALATVTTRTGGKHSPYANIISMSDGPVEHGSGVPFFYMTPMDLSSKDLAKENKASITVTLAQTSYCRQQSLDPEDPRCARVTLSGKIKTVRPGTPDEEFAQKAMFTRHPAMKTWPKDHEFHFAKLKIGQIVLLDQFGGAKFIDIEEYLNAGAPSI